MKISISLVLFCLEALAAGVWARPAPSQTAKMVNFAKLDPHIILDMRYATKNNFTHQRVYPVARCLLRPSVAKKLLGAAKDFESRGLRLVIFDCYRPLSIQKKFWALVPDERYVANPAKGSRHNRGAAVDVSLADSSGKELVMPSGFDDFSKRAHRNWKGSSPAARRDMKLLEAVMERHGLVGLPTEWWHFDAKGWKRFPIEDVPLTHSPGPKPKGV